LSFRRSTPRRRQGYRQHIGAPRAEAHSHWRANALPRGDGRDAYFLLALIVEKSEVHRDDSRAMEMRGCHGPVRILHCAIKYGSRRVPSHDQDAEDIDAPTTTSYTVNRQNQPPSSRPPTSRWSSPSARTSATAGTYPSPSTSQWQSRGITLGLAKQAKLLV
jgi:hypothetical protein